MYKFTLVLLSLLSFNLFATSGGCIVTSQPTATSGSTYNTCQSFNNQVSCDSNQSCSWNVVQYYKNYCSGTSVLEAPCPTGTTSVPFNAGAAQNSKFKCCRADDSGGSNNDGPCCNRGGNVVPSMTPCPTRTNPHQCCNPAGNPVSPIQASTNQCKEKPGKVRPRKLNLRK